MIEYKYKAKVIRVVDGDTLWVEIDLGMRISKRERIRLLGINAPETRGDSRPEGIEAKKYLISLIQKNGGSVFVETSKEGKYGRWLGVLYDNDGNDMNQAMIDAGHAVPYMV